MHCIHCGKEVPAEAEFCASCGKPLGATPKTDDAQAEKNGATVKKRTLGCLVILLMMGACIFAVSRKGGDPAATKEREARTRRIEAYRMSQGFVKKQLKTPMGYCFRMKREMSMSLPARSGVVSNRSTRSRRRIT